MSFEALRAFWGAVFGSSESLGIGACLWESNSARIGYRLRTKPLGALIRPRPQQNRLRPFTVDERAHLEHLSRSYTAPARHVARAKALLPVADGCRFTHHLLRAA